MKRLLLAVALSLCSVVAVADRHTDYLPAVEVPATENPELAQKQINDFIWSHWKARAKSGFVQFTFFTKEGERIQTQAVVGPDSGGAWRLAVTTLFQFSAPMSFSAYGIEQRADPSGKGYVLLLKDADGRKLAEW